MLVAPSAATGQAPSDDALWRQIESVRKKCDDGRSAADYFAAAEANRRELLRLVESYLMLFPGGNRRASAIRIELLTLFEIGVIDHGDWRALRERIARYADDPTATAEAGYWALVIGDGHEPIPSTPTSAPAANALTAAITHERAVPPEGAQQNSSETTTTRPSAEYGEPSRAPAIRRYAARFREGRHTPELLRELFDAAQRAGDLAAMREIVGALRGKDSVPNAASPGRDAESTSPATPGTAAGETVLAARLARLEAVGRPFAFEFRIAEGEVIDSEKWRGSPVVIVVWDSRTPSALKRLREVDGARKIHMETRTLGVNLDADVDEMRAVLRELEIAWPQFNDGRGRANAFARQWGIERTPLVFVIDAEGILVCAREDDSWQEELTRIAAHAAAPRVKRK